MARSRKEPEVIEFKEPLSVPVKRGRAAVRERNRFLRGNISEVFSSVGTEKSKAASDEEVKPSHLDLKETLREVQSLASSTLAGKERRRFEQEQMRALGAKPLKQEYVPYPHYQRVANARREKEKRVAEELRLTQMSTGKRRKEQKPRVRGKGRWKEKVNSLEPAVGKFKGGVLRLTKDDLTKVRSK